DDREVVAPQRDLPRLEVGTVKEVGKNAERVVRKRPCEDVPPEDISVEVVGHRREEGGDSAPSFTERRFQRLRLFEFAQILGLKDTAVFEVANKDRTAQKRLDLVFVHA